MTKTTYNPYSGEGRSLGQKSSIYMHVGGTFFGRNDVKKKDEARLRSLLRSRQAAAGSVVVCVPCPETTLLLF